MCKTIRTYYIIYIHAGFDYFGHSGAAGASNDSFLAPHAVDYPYNIMRPTSNDFGAYIEYGF